MRSAKNRHARRGLAPRARVRINRELVERAGGEAAEQAETLPPGRSGLGGFLPRQGPRLGEIAWLASLGFLVGGLELAVLSLLMLLDALRVLDLGWVPRDPAILALGVALTVGIVGWLLLGLVVEAGALPRLYGRRFQTSGNLGKLWIALAVAGGGLGGLAWIFPWLTSPVSEVLSRAWLLLLATGGAGVFIVGPVTVPILWLVERRAPAPTSKVMLPVLLVTWAAGAAVLFGWLTSRW
ncbi:MAG: hypothetical protein ACRDWX_07255 [Acidimicrobiia bacterium]